LRGGPAGRARWCHPDRASGAGCELASIASAKARSASASEGKIPIRRLSWVEDLAFVTLPTPMMCLQDRRPGRTPRWRGVTLAAELCQAGLAVAVGGDNCRDAWFPFGDHDMLDTVQQAVRVFQLDDPIAAAVAMAGPIPWDGWLRHDEVDCRRDQCRLHERMITAVEKTVARREGEQRVDRVAMRDGGDVVIERAECA
jgi:Amidohydrolase family